MDDYERLNTLSITVKQVGKQLHAFSLFRFAQPISLNPAVIPIFSKNTSILQIYVNSTKIDNDLVHWLKFEEPQDIEESEACSSLRLQSKLFSQISAREKFGDLYLDLSTLETQIQVESIGFVFVLKNCQNEIINMDSVFEGTQQFKFETPMGDASDWMPVPLLFMAERLSFSLQFALEKDYIVISSGEFAGNNKFINGSGLVHNIYFLIQKHLLFYQQKNVTIVFSKQYRIANFQLVKSIFCQLVDYLQSIEILFPHIQVIIEGDYDFGKLGQVASNILKFPLLNLPPDPSNDDILHIYQLAAQQLASYTRIIVPPKDICGLGFSLVFEQLFKLMLDKNFLNNNDNQQQFMKTQYAFAARCNYKMPFLFNYVKELPQSTTNTSFNIEQWKSTLLHRENGMVNRIDLDCQAQFSTMSPDYYQKVMNLYYLKLQQQNFDPKQSNIFQQSTLNLDSIFSAVGQTSQNDITQIGNTQSTQQLYNVDIEQLLFSDEVWPIYVPSDEMKLKELRAKIAAIYILQNSTNTELMIMQYLQLFYQNYNNFKNWCSGLNYKEQQQRLDGVGTNSNMFEQITRREDIKISSQQNYRIFDTICCINTATSAVKIIYQFVQSNDVSDQKEKDDKGKDVQKDQSQYSIRSYDILKASLQKVAFEKFYYQVQENSYQSVQEVAKIIYQFENNPFDPAINIIDTKSGQKHIIVDPDFRNPFMITHYFNPLTFDSNFKIDVHKLNIFYHIYPQILSRPKPFDLISQNDQFLNLFKQINTRMIFVKSLFLNIKMFDNFIDLKLESRQDLFKSLNNLIAEQQNTIRNVDQYKFFIEQLFQLYSNKLEIEDNKFVTKQITDFDIAQFLCLLGFQREIKDERVFQLADYYLRQDIVRGSSYNLISIAAYQSMVWQFLGQDENQFRQMDFSKNVSLIYHRMMTFALHKATNANTKLSFLGLSTFLFLNLDLVSHSATSVRFLFEEMLAISNILLGKSKQHQIVCDCVCCGQKSYPLLDMYKLSCYNQLFFNHLQLLMFSIQSSISQFEKCQIMSIISFMFQYNQVGLNQDYADSNLVQFPIQPEFIDLGRPAELLLHKYDRVSNLGIDALDDQLIKQAFPVLFGLDKSKRDLHQCSVWNCPQCCYGGSCGCARCYGEAEHDQLSNDVSMKIEHWTVLNAKEDVHNMTQIMNEDVYKLSSEILDELIKCSDMAAITSSDTRLDKDDTEKNNEIQYEDDIGKLRLLHIVQIQLLWSQLCQKHCNQFQQIFMVPLKELLKDQSLIVRKSAVKLLDAVFGFQQFKFAFDQLQSDHLLLDRQLLIKQFRYLRIMIESGYQNKPYEFPDDVLNSFVIHQFGQGIDKSKLGAGFLRLYKK